MVWCIAEEKEDHHQSSGLKHNLALPYMYLFILFVSVFVFHLMKTSPHPPGERQ